MTFTAVPLQADAAVYGVIMNDQASLQRLGQAATQPPYKGLPAAPVLYLKPRNTWAASGARVCLPAGQDRVEIGAVAGVRLGRDAGRLSVDDALDAVDACVLAADLSLPHAEYFRPAVRQKCFDGALPITLLPGLSPAALPQLVLHTQVDGQAVDSRALGQLLRSPAQLLADVTEFMTLRRGDILLLGVVYQSPQAGPGARVRIQADGYGALDFTLDTEAP